MYVRAQISRVAGIFVAASLTLSACDAPEPELARKATPVETDAVEAVSDGQRLYAEYCASCHNRAVYKAPHFIMLNMMTPETILDSMNGIMATQSADLNDEQKRVIAEFITGRALGTSVQASAPRCDEPSIDLRAPRRQVGFGFDPYNTRFQPQAAGGLQIDNIGGLELRWAFAYPRAIQARSQPTVAAGSVFVGSHDGSVFALDAETGCVRWQYQADAEVRTPVIVSDWDTSDPEAAPLAFAADILARVSALDARTGELIWTVRVDDQPNATITGAPSLHDGRLYVPVSSLEVASAADPTYACCTFRGALVALDANTGEQVWKSYTIDETPSEIGKTSVGTAIFAPSGAPIWNSPTIDASRGRLYIGTGENYTSPAGATSDAIIAFALEDGRKLWVNQATAGDAWNVGCLSDYTDNPANCPEENGPDFDFAASPILLDVDADTQLLVAGQKSGDVLAIDPDNGETVWRTKVGRGGVQGGVHFGMAVGEGRIYVPMNDMEYPEDVTRYKFTTPPRPGLFALDPLTGRELWASPAQSRCRESDQYCDPGISAAITAIPGGVIAGHLDGALRAYSGADGKVLWEHDTRAEVETVSGATASGGSMSGGGPVVANSWLYVNSGYGLFFHMPGNVLLAFGPAAD